MNIVSWSELLDVDRQGTSIVAKFHKPFRVLSTSGSDGGQRDDVTAVYNHQGCEAAGDHDGEVHRVLMEKGPQLHRDRCHELGVDPDQTVKLGTAANMRCLGVSQHQFGDLQVAAVCTAGVEGNAGRAGDPATIAERDGSFEAVSQVRQPAVGTIVTMLFFNRELTPGALARSLMMATEAKTAVLQDLVVGSRYSSGLATGTGTDQFMGACPIGAGVPLTGAGKHVKTGELIAKCVAEAIEDALILQNGLTRTSRRSLTAQLRRFGLTEQVLVDWAHQLLPPATARMLADNLISVDRDPHVVAAGAAIATVADQLANGILPQTCADDYAATLGSMLAAATAGVENRLDEFRNALTDQTFEVTELVPAAICLGYSRKWEHLFHP